MAGVSRVPSNYKLLGRHSLNTAFVTAATHTTLQDEGLTVSVTYGASRILRVTLVVHPYTSGGLQSLNYKVLRTATQVLYATTYAQSATLPVTNVYSQTFSGPSSGATETFKVQIQAGGLNTAVNSGGDANLTRQLIIEDLGPQ